MPALIRPPVRYYGIGIVLLLLAGLAGARLYHHRVEAVTAGLAQMVVPGTGEIGFPRPGHGAVFLEHRSVVDGSLFLTLEDPGDLSLTLISPGGREVPLRRAWLPLRYALDQRAGRILFDFRVEEPGTYLLRAAYPSGTAGTSMVLAVGYGLLGDLSAEILGGLGAVGGLGLAGLISLLIVERRRARCRRGIYGRFGR